MAAESKYKMSQERYDEIKQELHYLETVREKEVSELIKEALSFGDLSENSEYDEAKTEQGDVYKRQALRRSTAWISRSTRGSSCSLSAPPAPARPR